MNDEQNKSTTYIKGGKFLLMYLKLNFEPLTWLWRWLARMSSNHECSVVDRSPTRTWASLRGREQIIILITLKLLFSAFLVFFCILYSLLVALQCVYDALNNVNLQVNSLQVCVFLKKRLTCPLLVSKDLKFIPKTLHWASKFAPQRKK